MSKRKPMTLDKAVKIHNLVEVLGVEKAAESLNMKQLSLERRLREIKQFHDLTRERLQSLPKVLLFDIETTPMQVFVWGLFGNKYINYENIVKDWNVLSWAGKWLFKEEKFGDILTPDEAIKGDDSRIAQSIWEKFEEADIVIAHNGDKFDIKKLNTRFILNGLTPPTPYKSIDTLSVSKKYFKFSSNRLDYLGQLMANKEKIHTDFQLWIKCLNGDQQALDYMMDYNIQDVDLLEEVYLELRPWIKSHPNLALYIDSEFKQGVYGCSNCGKIHNPEIINWVGNYTTNISQFKVFRCDCGAMIKTRKSHRVAPLMGTSY